MLHTLTFVAIIAFATVASGIGIGCLAGATIFGTNTVTGRGRSMMAGFFGGLFTLFCLFWLARIGMPL